MTICIDLSCEEILVLPSGESSSVTTVEKFLDDRKTKAVAGESTGITIKDKLFIDRGNVICIKGDKPTMTKQIKGNLFWMDKEPLRNDEHVVFKCSTQETRCTVESIQRRMDSSTLEVLEENAEALQNREVGEVVLSFSDDMIFEDFNKTPELGRFVIEKGYDTAGGGIITHLGEEK